MPKDKAKKLVERFLEYPDCMGIEEAKDYSLICVSETIATLNKIIEEINGYSNDGDWLYSSLLEKYVEDLEEEMEEINKL